MFGCGEKKADPAKIEEANKLVASKDFEKGVDMLDDMAKASPSDEMVKKAQISAHMQYANYFMYETNLPPKEKYPSALEQYRFVAAIDPGNSEAKQSINLIEGIYSQMGRPIPK
jgi:tetratricopeptide (TPR) repeat protein